MAPTATGPVLGDKGANGAHIEPSTIKDTIGLITSKLSGLGNVATAAACGVTSAVKEPTLDSKAVMEKESRYGAHK